MEVEVMSHGVMVVLVVRRVLSAVIVGGLMVMTGMRMMRRMRLGMANVDMHVRRDLEQVRHGQGQDHAGPER